MEQLEPRRCLKNMRASSTGLIALCVIASLIGCRDVHRRPANVPSSAVWVDNTFIDCSVDAQSNTNRCTIYGDRLGEILADGLFALNNLHVAVGTPELRYTAYGHGTIYLEDAKMLVHVAPGKRDPSRERITRTLETLAMKGSSGAIDCGRGEVQSKIVSACSLQAFQEKRAFYFSHYEPGTESFHYKGVAASETGDAYEVDYSSIGLANRVELPKGWELLDDNHTEVIPCHRPVIFHRTYGGWLVCRSFPME